MGWLTLHQVVALAEDLDQTASWTDRRSDRALTPFTTDLYDDFWYFAHQRQSMYLARLEGKSRPWTTDPVLNGYRFTNVYRASDRVSQYLIRDVQYAGSQRPEDLVFRTLLFKVFNRIDTWEYLQDAMGDLRLDTFDWSRAERLLDGRLSAGQRIYSAAYIMPSPQLGYARKHQNHLRLLQDSLAAGLADRVSHSESLEDLYRVLAEIPSFGPFLAFQFAIDLNYTSVVDHDEMEFVVAGPGALDGLSKTFVGFASTSADSLLRCVCSRQQQEFSRRGLPFPGLWGRPLQLIDVQNLFCEISKYSRVARPDIVGVSGRTKIKQKYSGDSSLPPPFFPPKWDLDVRFEGVDEREGS